MAYVMAPFYDLEKCQKDIVIHRVLTKGPPEVKDPQAQISFRWHIYIYIYMYVYIYIYIILVLYIYIYMCFFASEEHG